MKQPIPKHNPDEYFTKFLGYHQVALKFLTLKMPALCEAIFPSVSPARI